MICSLYLFHLSWFSFILQINQNMEKGIRIPKFKKVWLVESGIWGVLESGIQHRKSRIPLRIGIRNPSSPDKQFQSSWNQDCLGFLYMGPNGT